MLKKDFLLTTKTGACLYEKVKALPIIDYHNHLSLQDISENKRYLDVYDLWIAPDPYKHRAMRMCGVAEEYITGNADKEEKFVKWCETLPKLFLHPLFHWSYMEMEKVFGVTEKIDGENARKLYAYCNEYLQKNEITVGSLLKGFGVEYACPCASLTDELSVFGGDCRFAPSLRGDDILLPNEKLLRVLERQTGIVVDTLSNYKQAIALRLDEFEKYNCRFSDHALDNGFHFYEEDGENDARFLALCQGGLDKEGKDKLFSHLLTFMAQEYAKRGFVMQLHIGAERFTSSKLREKAGAAGGFAGIGNSVDIASLTKFLDKVDCSADGLPKTMLFTLNPADNAMLSVLSGSYSKDGMEGLVTQGPAWWWCDHKQGIVEMLENTSVFGLLSNFVGMTTDSRSFLSFARHDYFRRVLCDWLGEKWEGGELFCAQEEVENLTYQLCYGNAKKIVNKEEK